jgi:hypothetical protein
MIDFGDTVTRIEPTIDEIARVAYAPGPVARCP